MPFALHTAASSSGVDAPSRKLNADRACSSTYISRTLRAQTSIRVARRNKSDTGRNPDATQKQRQPQSRRARRTPGENESPDPNRLAASHLRATNRPTCATGLRRPERLRAAPEKQRAWDGLPTAQAPRASAGETSGSSPTL